MNSAIITGTTGLIGKHLLQQLLDNDKYTEVIIIVRRPIALTHPKLKQQVVDFEELPHVLNGLNAKHAFCCLGTTIAKAGSKAAQFRIDHDYVINFAKACHAMGIEKFAVVSSIGANAGSSNFYLKTKGQMEEDLQSIRFKNLFILRPSILLGKRDEFRLGEKIGTIIIKLVGPFLFGSLKKYRGVHASKVAACMIKQVLIENIGCKIIESGSIQ
jgi:uncharacterized protein YbjT (DUF2867 family)